MQLPDFRHEVDLWKKGFSVIGIDEVGRGAFAGPLFVGGVVFSPHSNIKYLESLGINDSKKLKPQTRKSLSEVIQKECFSYYISQINVTQINRFGIGKSTFMAMRDVVKNLRETISNTPTFVLVDGFYIKRLRGIGTRNQKGIIHGDCISLSIAAASVIAKVARDEHMKNLSTKFPAYGWGRNKGYGTLEHRNALGSLGSTPLHRSVFVENFI